VKVDLEAIKARLAAATPGPGRAYAEFIACAPSDLAALVARVEELERVLTSILGACKCCEDEPLCKPCQLAAAALEQGHGG
jgi:hypothetical protein